MLPRSCVCSLLWGLCWPGQRQTAPLYSEPICSGWPIIPKSLCPWKCHHGQYFGGRIENPSWPPRQECHLSLQMKNPERHLSSPQGFLAELSKWCMGVRSPTKARNSRDFFNKIIFVEKYIKPTPNILSLYLWVSASRSFFCHRWR